MKRLLFVGVFALIYVLFLSSCTEKEQEITVQSIAISQPSAELVIGETLNLKATVSPSNATYDGITWTSTKTSVATVSGSGQVSALAEGNTTITAMAGGKTASCSVTVVKGYVAVSSISLNKDSIELVEGDSETLTATVSPNDATDRTVSWSSSNDAVATVKDGTVTAVKEGEATITAKAGEKTASCKVVVAKKVIPVESIELNKTELALVEGDTETLTATISPEDATDKTITWTSSKESVATVKDGVVSAVSEGEATITAKAGEKTASCKVVVAKKVIPVESIELNKTELELVEGDSETLTAIISPENATDKTITWTSSKESVATVKDGVVSAISEGEATITAKAGSVTAICTIIVKEVVPKAKLSLVVEAGTLKERIESLGIDYLNVQELTVSGDLNGDDMALIRTMAGNDKYFIQEGNTPSDGSLEILNMKDANLIPGNEVYMYFSGKNYTITQKNVIPYSMFRACVRLKEIVLPKSCRFSSEALFTACYSLESIEIPSTVSTIPMNCFSGCRNLKEISIPYVTKIDEWAFWGCTSLSRIEFGRLSSISPKALYCPSLITISIPDSNSYFCVVDGALLSKDKTILYYYCGGLTGRYSTPTTVEQIGAHAFQSSQLSELVLSNGLRAIGEQAVASCLNMTSIVVMSSVPPQQGASMFNGTLCPIYVPYGSVEAYKTAWSKYASRIYAITD